MAYFKEIPPGDMRLPYSFLPRGCRAPVTGTVQTRNYTVFLQKRNLLITHIPSSIFREEVGPSRNYRISPNKRQGVFYQVLFIFGSPKMNMKKIIMRNFNC
jgi:hypothetical protein